MRLVLSLAGGALLALPDLSPNAVAATPSAPAFHYIRRLGFFDAAHTRSDTYQFTEISGLTSAGIATGTSYRYVGGQGQTAWIAHPDGRTVRVGLFDADHTSSTGRQLSQPMNLSASGHVLGESVRFGGGGVSAWCADTAMGATVRLGLIDAAHTAPGIGSEGIVPQISPGTQESWAWNIADVGIIAGTSRRYSLPYSTQGAQITTETGWIADVDGLVVPLMITDAAHTFVTSRGESIRNSYVSIVSESGLVAGFATRYASGFADAEILAAQHGQTAFIADISGWMQPVGLFDGEHLVGDRHFSSIYVINDEGYSLGASSQILGSEGGETTWFADPSGTTTRVGLYGPEYVNVYGAHQNIPFFLTEQGYISGQAYTVNAARQFSGRTAWIAHIGGDIVAVGLDDAEHHNADGRSSDHIVGMNDSGITHGTSERFLGQDSAQSATGWMANPAGTTERIGLYGPDYESATGQRFSEGWAISDNGYVLGGSFRFTPGGFISWVAAIGEGTRRIGLYDATHTRDDGYQDSPAFSITRSGIVSGASRRYRGGAAELGQTAWIYDTRTHQQVVFALSERPGDGYAFSTIDTVTEDGRVGGTYRLFDAKGVDLGERAFVYLPGIGTRDVGTSLDRPLATTMWHSLTSVRAINDSGYIAGHGVPGNPTLSSRGAYLVRDRQMGPAPLPFDQADVIVDGVHHVYYCPRSALFRYTLTLGNAGPDAAREVVVQDALPTGMLFFRAQATSGQWTTPKQWHQGKVTWYLDQVGTDVEDLQQMVIWAYATKNGTYTNKVSVYTATPDEDAPSNRTQSSVTVQLAP